MTAPAVVVRPETTQQEAAELMSRHQLHHLPVLEGGRLVGIVSAADLVLPAGRSRAPASRTARIAEVMHRDPVVLGHNSTLHDAAVLLASGGYHSLPVTDSAGTVLGIVTSSDLIEVLVRQLPASGEASASEHRTLPGNCDRVCGSRQLSTAAVSEAGQPMAARRNDRPGRGRTPLPCQPALTDLENVRRAADIYLRSGQGEHEHAELVRALEKARESLGPGLPINRL